MARKPIMPGASLAFPTMLDPIGAINPALAKSDPAIMISSTPFGVPGEKKFYAKRAVPWKGSTTAYPNQPHLNRLKGWATGTGEKGVVLASINGRLVLVPRHAAETAKRAGASVVIVGEAPNVYQLYAAKAAMAVMP